MVDLEDEEVAFSVLFHGISVPSEQSWDREHEFVALTHLRVSQAG